MPEHLSELQSCQELLCAATHGVIFVFVCFICMIICSVFGCPCTARCNDSQGTWASCGDAGMSGEDYCVDDSEIAAQYGTPAGWFRTVCSNTCGACDNNNDDDWSSGGDPSQPPSMAPTVFSSSGDPGQAPSMAPTLLHNNLHSDDDTDDVNSYGGNDGGCNDNPSEWRNDFGDDCDWYATAPEAGQPTNCEKHGDEYGTGGMTANEACCACGGGIGVGGGGCYDDDAMLAAKR